MAVCKPTWFFIFVYIFQLCQSVIHEVAFVPLDPCAQNRCAPGLICVADGSKDGYSCQCPVASSCAHATNNFVLTTKKPRFNPCANYPCHNNGICIPAGYNHGDFLCSCPEGFFGPLCQFPDFCRNDPCLSGGTCLNDLESPTGYQCFCPTGFYGTRCENLRVFSNDCVNTVCLHGGVCLRSLDGNERCVCSGRFRGEMCEFVRSNPCEQHRCEHGGICKANKDYRSYTCKCPRGLTGRFCHIPETAQCQADTCLYGSCEVVAGRTRCHCFSGFIGDRCEVNVDDCQSNPCRNGGLCVDGVDSFHCVCPSGFTGPFCDLRVTSVCQLEPCLNGGHCVPKDRFGGYVCQCREGFFGDTCDETAEEYDENLVDELEYAEEQAVETTSQSSTTTTTTTVAFSEQNKVQTTTVVQSTAAFVTELPSVTPRAPVEVNLDSLVTSRPDTLPSDAENTLILQLYSLQHRTFGKIEASQLLANLHSTLNASVNYVLDSFNRPEIYHWSTAKGRGSRLDLQRSERLIPNQDENLSGIEVILKFNFSENPAENFHSLSEIIGFFAEAPAAMLAKALGASVYEARLAPQSNSNTPKNLWNIVVISVSGLTAVFVVFGVMFPRQRKNVTVLSTYEPGYSINDGFTSTKSTPCLTAKQDCSSRKTLQLFPLHDLFASLVPVTEVPEELQPLLHDRDPHNRTCMHVSVLAPKAESDIVVEIELLCREGLSLDAGDADNVTPLMLAIRLAKFVVAQHLLQLGADVNAVDWRGRTAVYDAVACGDLEMLQSVLKVEGVKAVVKVDANDTALKLAVARGNVALVEALLAHPSMTDPDCVGNTKDERCLHFCTSVSAIYANNEDMLRLLIAQGLRVDMLDSLKRSPLFHAIGCGNQAIIELILRHLRPEQVDPSTLEQSSPHILALDIGRQTGKAYYLQLADRIRRKEHQLPELPTADSSVGCSRDSSGFVSQSSKDLSSPESMPQPELPSTSTVNFDTFCSTNYARPLSHSWSQSEHSLIAGTSAYSFLHFRYPQTFASPPPAPPRDFCYSQINSGSELSSTAKRPRLMCDDERTNTPSLASSLFDSSFSCHSRRFSQISNGYSVATARSYWAHGPTTSSHDGHC